MSNEELQFYNDLFAHYNRRWQEMKMPTLEEMRADVEEYRRENDG